jgi:hypothetical protein
MRARLGVRFPPGQLVETHEASNQYTEDIHRHQGVGKSGNPPALGAGERGFKSHRPDFVPVWSNGKAAAC